MGAAGGEMPPAGRRAERRAEPSGGILAVRTEQRWGRARAALGAAPGAGAERPGAGGGLAARGSEGGGRWSGRAEPGPGPAGGGRQRGDGGRACAPGEPRCGTAGAGPGELPGPGRWRRSDEIQPGAGAGADRLFTSRGAGTGPSAAARAPHRAGGSAASTTLVPSLALLSRTGSGGTGTGSGCRWGPDYPGGSEEPLITTASCCLCSVCTLCQAEAAGPSCSPPASMAVAA